MRPAESSLGLLLSVGRRIASGAYSSFTFSALPVCRAAFQESNRPAISGSVTLAHFCLVGVEGKEGEVSGFFRAAPRGFAVRRHCVPWPAFCSHSLACPTSSGRRFSRTQAQRAHWCQQLASTKAKEGGAAPTAGSYTPPPQPAARGLFTRTVVGEFGGGTPSPERRLPSTPLKRAPAIFTIKLGVIQTHLGGRVGQGRDGGRRRLGSAGALSAARGRRRSGRKGDGDQRKKGRYHA